MSESMQQTSQTDIDALWARYKKSQDIKLRNEIVLLYSWLVKRIVLRFRGRTANYIQLDDLINHGMIALIDAVEKFDPSRGHKFETFASIKIRGAAIDCMREQDWVPRTQRSLAKELEDAYHGLYAELGREPTREELSKRMDVDEEYLDKIMHHRHDAFLLSFEETVHEKSMSAYSIYNPSELESSPEQSLLQTELKGHLMEAIERLGERERLVISLYYTENLKLKEIAEVIGVSESRVSQLHTQALLKLKNILTSLQEA